MSSNWIVRGAGTTQPLGLLLSIAFLELLVQPVTGTQSSAPYNEPVEVDVCAI